MRLVESANRRKVVGCGFSRKTRSAQYKGLPILRFSIVRKVVRGLRRWVWVVLKIR